jgi:uncharacterized membrane protein
MTLALLSLLTGMTFGMRFKILILLPVIACVLPIAFAVSLLEGGSAWSMFLAVVMPLVGVQLGYLAGIGIRHSLALARLSRLRNTFSGRAQLTRHSAH